MARLWKRFNGEPFMINPHLGVLGLNPKTSRRRKAATVAKKNGRAHMAWVRSFQKGKKNAPARKRRRARRNPWPVAGLVANPRRKRARRNPAAHHHHHRRHHHYRRNPSVMGFSLPPLQSVLYAGVGFAGTPIAEGFLSGFLPAAITQNTIGRYAVKIGTVIGLTYAAKAIVGREAAKMVGIGGGAYLLISAVKEFAPGVIPGLGAYVPANRSLGAYTPARRSAGGLGAPAFGARNTAGFAGSGASNVVASRFRRFQ